jgi:hypothetical protein
MPDRPFLKRDASAAAQLPSPFSYYHQGAQAPVIKLGEASKCGNTVPFLALVCANRSEEQHASSSPLRPTAIFARLTKKRLAYVHKAHAA